MIVEYEDFDFAFFKNILEKGDRADYRNVICFEIDGVITAVIEPIKPLPELNFYCCSYQDDGEWHYAVLPEKYLGKVVERFAKN